MTIMRIIYVLLSKRHTNTTDYMTDKAAFRVATIDNHLYTKK